jgi:head-tail adaptor
VKTGRFDTPVTILTRETTRDARYKTRTSVAGWVPSVTVLAEVEDMLPSRGDRVAPEISLTRRPARIRMHWRDDVSQANRLRIGPPPATGAADNRREMRIVSGPAELGRRQVLELIAEELSTEGQEP